MEPSSGSPPALVLAFSPGGRGVERCALGEASIVASVVIGRDALLFPGGLLDDGKLSRRHAELSCTGGRWQLRDLDSRNGTFLDGVRLTGPRPLEPGGVIRVGSTLMLFTRVGENQTPPDHPLVGMSDLLASVRRAITGAARGRAALVTGDTGTGKELVANALHRQSGRSGKLVAVNCGVLSQGMIASELFGHLRGAYTGAVSDSPGLFRAAHRGTLFLDEIGELPLELQVQLLRALESGRVRPVGGSDEVAVDVLVVGATNRDLGAEIRQSRFRADLYARLAQWLIHIPPLRERREDIPVLVRHLLARLGAGERPLSVELAEALLLHPWPLNVRGLYNVLSVAVSAGEPDQPLALGPEVRALLDASVELAAPPAAERAVGLSAERVKETLARTHGQVRQAAQELGCTRQQLYRWMARHNIDVNQFREKS